MKVICGFFGASEFGSPTIHFDSEAFNQTMFVASTLMGRSPLSIKGLGRRLDEVGARSGRLRQAG